MNGLEQTPQGITAAGRRRSSTSYLSERLRRDWRATLIADGIVIVRASWKLDPPFIEMTERFASEVHLYAE